MNLKHFTICSDWRKIDIGRGTIDTISMGRGNGYVVIPEEHPCYGMDYDKINVDVHGGLTYGSFVKEGSTFTKYCNVGDYVVGFDTAHSGDNEENRTEENVKKETIRLKKQLEKVTQ